MSIISTRNDYSNNYLSNCNIQNRSEFLQKFKQERLGNNNNNQKNNSSNYQGRWDYLHDLNKLRIVKIEEKRQQIEQEREESMYSECTFSPKLNKSATYDNISQPSVMNRQDSEQYLIGLLGRQEAWNQRKFMKIEEGKQLQELQSRDQCFFRPEVNPPNALNKSHLKTTATKLVEDPESYTMFVGRISNKRKENEALKARQKTLPGSGNIWNNKPKKYDLSYDYTQHNHSERSLPKVKGANIGFNKKTMKRQFSANAISTSNRYTNTNNINVKNQYFEDIYTTEKPKENNDYNNNNTNHKRLNSKEKIQYNNLNYDKAIAILHHELYSFPLLNDE